MKTLKTAVPMASAGLMKALILTISFVGLLSFNSYADDGQDLIEAAEKGDTARVKALLVKGTDVNKRTKDSITALLVASINGYTEIVKMLIDRGVDVNAKDQYGITALMWASFQGYSETVKVLIDKGADVNAKDKYGETALSRAVGGVKRNLKIIDGGFMYEETYTPSEIIQLLKKAGAKE